MKMDLKTARVAAGMTQGEVAEKLGVSLASVCHWERGRRAPKVTTFFRLCELYRVSPNDIFLPVVQGRA